jgi:hypothetical protein
MRNGGCAQRDGVRRWCHGIASRVNAIFVSGARLTHEMRAILAVAREMRQNAGRQARRAS